LFRIIFAPMPTGTQIAYYHLCHRKLWLFAHDIQMEHTSELVAEGKLIEESAYPQRAHKWQEIEIERIKIDRFDPKLKVIREIKKSNRKESAHLAQLKYYIFVLERNGIEVSHGILEYPKLRITEEVWLTDEDRDHIPLWEQSIEAIIKQAKPPAIINKSTCKKCAYFDFCYSE